MIDINRYKKNTTLKKKVLQIIYERKKVSRTELAEITGLSITSVIKFVSALISEGIVIECGTLESTGGRKTALLGINPDYAYILSVDLGGFASKVGIVRMDGSIVEDWLIPTEKSNVPVKGFTLQSLCEQIDEIFKTFDKERFIAICIGVSGMVDNKTGTVIFCPNISGWDNVALSDKLFGTYGIPTFVDTSSRCMALAEMNYGAGVGVLDQIFISLGSIDIAVALIFDSQLFRGSFGFSGEFGHVMCSDEGQRCTCGNYDCLELSATLPEITLNIMDRIKDFNGFSPLKNMLPVNYSVSDITPQKVNQAIAAGDKRCYEAVMVAGMRTGIALSNLLNIINPELVVIGGGVIECFPIILDIIKQTIKERSLTIIQQNLLVKKAELGWHSAIIGAAILAQIEFFY